MKKITQLFVLCLVVLSACQPQTQPVDFAAEESAVKEVLDQIVAAGREPSAEKLLALFSEDIVSIGTDPTEFWTAQEVRDMFNQMLTQPVELKMVGEPVVKIAPDGHSAFASHEYYMPMFSEKILFRNGYSLYKTEGKWKIFAINSGCILKNEDLPKIDEVVSE